MQVCMKLGASGGKTGGNGKGIGGKRLAGVLPRRPIRAGGVLAAPELPNSISLLIGARRLGTVLVVTVVMLTSWRPWCAFSRGRLPRGQAIELGLGVGHQQCPCGFPAD